MSNKIAFLGTGLMGARMIKRLVAGGCTVRVWNRTAEKAEILRGFGALPCRSAVSAAEGADLVCLCLTDAKAVENIAFNPDFTQRGPSNGATVIDFSTIGIAASRAFAGRLKAETGGDWVDAPVSGGVAGAAGGTLAIFVGADNETYARVLPVLQLVGRQITLMGPPGAGQATKLCNQIMVATNFAAIAEAVSLGKFWGIDVRRLAEALSGGWADSAPLRLYGPRMASSPDPGPRVSELRTMYKDILAIRTAAATRRTPLLTMMQELYGALVEAGFGSEDFPALMRNYTENE